MMKNKLNYCFLIISIFFLTCVSTSCQQNPATGESEFNLMSEKEEDDVGKSEHKKIIKQFGGIYEDEQLNNYIKSLGNFLVATSELPNKKFTFTILNTPIVNAFALPGGYIYVTRGLIYLCQNEAQLAGVIAHEIGHVTARHTAKRYTKTVGTGIVLQILNVFSQNTLINNLLGQSAQLYLLSYSRSQEHQADQLAVRYMIRAGFDAKEMANFLKSMEEYAILQKQILNIKDEVSELLKTHPNSSKRVSEVIENYKGKIPLNPIVGKDIFLKKIDGMLYGHRKEEGFFIGNSFVHIPLGIRFEFSNKFYFINQPNALIGKSKDNTKIIFDLEETNKMNDLEYISKWLSTPKKKIVNYKSFSNGDYNISSGEFIKNKKNIFFATLKDNSSITFRFVLINENKSKKEEFIDMVKSFRKIDQNALSTLSPPKIRITSASSDTKFFKETVLKSRLQKMFAFEMHKTLNNLENNQIEVGDKIKTIY